MPGFLDYALERTVAPTDEPVVLGAAKHQCNLELAETAFDKWFESGEGCVGAIAAARELVESRAQICLMPQTWQLKLAAWPDDSLLDLLVHPVRTAVVTYVDANGATQTWNSANYELQRNRSRSLLVKSDTDTVWPTVDGSKPRPITLTLTCGYHTPGTDTTAQQQRAKVPAAARHAILLLLGHWFKNREATVVGTISGEIELSFASLLSTLRPARYS